MFKPTSEDKRKIAAKLGLFLAIFSALLFIDLVSKQIVYDASEIGTGEEVSWGIVGWRSYLNHGSTFFNRLDITLSNATHIAFNIGSMLFVLFVIAFTEKKSTVITLSIVAAGVFGNGIDRMAFSGVRDIVFIPWIKGGQLGTFNFADCFVVIGALIWGLITIKNVWTED